MAKLPKVWLLGDSIRMSYQPLVAEAMADRAEVVGPAENGQFSLYTLASLHRWYEQFGRPDVVHWNNGIHDAGHNPARVPRQIPLEIYVMTLGLILEALRAWTPRVIWATSTPPHPRKLFLEDQWSWRAGEFDRYHQSAVELMRAEEVAINDLHSIVSADYTAALAADQLHLSESGTCRCAEAVVKAVDAML